MAEIQTVHGYRDIMVKLGMSQPSSRALVAGSVAALLMYLAKFPKASFREDGSMKPLQALSVEPDATYTHFLLCPSVVAISVFLFT